MNANILQDFRVMQIAFFGAYAMKHDASPSNLLLEGIDRISIGDNIEIIEINLHIDYVVVAIGDIRSFMPITSLSDKVMLDVISTLKAKALDVANRDVMVNGRGEITK